jgi:hypothetical protein
MIVKGVYRNRRSLAEETRTVTVHASRLPESDGQK